jgi:hypothetical protein
MKPHNRNVLRMRARIMEQLTDEQRAAVVALARCLASLQNAAAPHALPDELAQCLASLRTAMADMERCGLGMPAWNTDCVRSKRTTP